MPGTERPPSVPTISVGHARISDATTAAPTSYPGSTSSPPDYVKVCPTCGLRYPGEFKVCPRDAAELVEVQPEAQVDELVGKTIADTYAIVRMIGEGGMGKVYEARHTRLGSKRFAVKLLHGEYARQADVLTRFQREAEAAATIRSPYVVDVYDVDRTEDGRPFLVAEHLEGKEFASYLDEVGKMEVGAAVRVVRQVCKALTAAHDRGVVHRDMKPENVFLTGDPAEPIAKVIDFGISKLADRPGTALTKTGMIMGTPSYMAPEQARGERVDHRADIYAVGAILYCALTGQRPFDRGDPTATLTAVLTQDPPRPRSIVPTIPEPLEMIIQRAMAKRPEDRYATMADLDAELAAYEPGVMDPMIFSSMTPDAMLRVTDAAQRRTGSLHRQVRLVSMARPMILVLGALGLFWAAGNLVLAITAIIRILKGGGARDNLTGQEAVLLLLGVTFTLLTPLVLVGYYLKRTVWGNSVKAVDLSEKIRGPVLAGLVAYGFGTMLVRILDAVLLRRAAGVAWPWWDLILLVIGGIAAAGALLVDELDRPRG
jgi:serine/threonine protein kinase